MARGKSPAAERLAVSFPLAVVVFGVIGWIVTTLIRYPQSEDRYRS
ncbi:MAG: hypothetical protein K6T63_06300 [Alicyclobacillus herbarius]|nr:hypothetical protein [Alicyclobacillus herbarius]MCL6632232.1 hypothetical protein [Alicyclobacillus herbarius]